MTHRLLNIARAHWATFDGWAAARNVDPLDLPPDRMLSLIYYWSTRNASSSEEINKFDRRLWLPPKGTAAPKGSPWSAEAETAAFGSLAAQVGVQTKGGLREGSTVKPS